MLKLFDREKTHTLKMEINSILENLRTMDPSSEEYTKAVANLKELYEASSIARKLHVSPDTLAMVGGNLLGILMILKFEKLDVITSKALGFVLKGRV